MIKIQSFYGRSFEQISCEHSNTAVTLIILLVYHVRASPEALVRYYVKSHLALHYLSRVPCQIRNYIRETVYKLLKLIRPGPGAFGRRKVARQKLSHAELYVNKMSHPRPSQPSSYNFILCMCEWNVQKWDSILPNLIIWVRRASRRLNKKKQRGRNDLSPCCRFPVTYFGGALSFKILEMFWQAITSSGATQSLLFVPAGR